MRTKHFLLATQKETPSEAEITSHQLMLRAGMIRKISSGIYTWLPLGLRVLNKVANIVREEMNTVGAQEILMSMTQPAELWEASGRWEEYGKELLRFKDRHDNSFCLGPTHEEVITTLAHNEYKSYKQLPQTLFQIQTKFRDEIRPRFGVMRSREFLMKDAYSFHTDMESLNKTYDEMFQAYTNIFTRLGLEFRAVKADSGSIGGDTSHEFHVLADSGEDELAYCPDSDYAANTELPELQNAKDGDPSPDGKGPLKIIRGIEVGHIFQLGDKYSQPLKATVLDKQGKAANLQMGCYGIGISRIVAAAIEQNHDERGIIWPDAIAPFQIALIPICYDKSEAVQKKSDKIYSELQEAGFSVIFDDRKERPGIKFADMDLIGVPHRIVIGERSLKENQLEYKSRTANDSEMISSEDYLDFLIKKLA